jgi:hypothetical protein
VEASDIFDLAILIGIAVLWFVFRNRVTPDQVLSRELGLRPANPFRIERHGRSFTVRVTPADARHEPKLQLTVNVDERDAAPGPSGAPGDARRHLATRPHAVFCARSPGGTVGESTGFDAPFATGDGAFDAAVHASTSGVAEDLATLLADAALRERVRAVVAAGGELTLDPDGLSATFLGAPPSRERFEAGATLIAEVSGALPTFTKGKAKSSGLDVGALFILLGFLLCPMSIVLGASADVETRGIYAAARWGVLLGLAAMGLALVRARGRIDGLRRAVTWSVAVLLCVPGPAFAALLIANVRFDGSPPVMHATTALNKQENVNRRVTLGYAVEVPNWTHGKGDPSRWLSCSKALFERASSGTPLGVTTHAGFFGWEWVSAVQLVPPAHPAR